MPESRKRKPSLPSQIVRHRVENACPFQRILDAGELPSFKRCQRTYLPELLTLIPPTPGFTRGPHLNVQQLAPRKGMAGEHKCLPPAGLKTAHAPASSSHALHPSAIDPAAAKRCNQELDRLEHSESGYRAGSNVETSQQPFKTTGGLRRS
jgi:hypothetical protein